MGRLGSEITRPNGGCQEHAPILTAIYGREAGKGLITISLYAGPTFSSAHSYGAGGAGPLKRIFPGYLIT